MSGVTHADVQRLAEPTPRERIKSRQGPGGRMLDYVDARFVMDRLDELGPGNWQDQYQDRPNGSVRCGIGVNVEGEWIWKWDVGDESDIEAEKGAHSDAFKRAGVKWGIGRDLYGDHAHPNGNGRAAAPPARPPAAPQRPVPHNAAAIAQIMDSLPDEPAWAAPDGGGTPQHLAAVNAPTPVPPTNVQTDRPMDIRDGAYSDVCPEHNSPWRTNSRGYYCSRKTDGEFCKWQPNRKWIAEHEVVTA